MAASMGTRRSAVVLPLVICSVFAIIVMMTTSVALADSDESMYRSRSTSSFVRRSLEARMESGMVTSQTYNPFRVTSSGSFTSQVRRLAGTATCATNTNVCNDATTYGPNATCCASTGLCKQLQTDRTNCGFCMYTCAGSLACCGGMCTSTMTDTVNCGTCGTVCKNSLCTNGLCGYGG